jgi:hypothetical protein
LASFLCDPGEGQHGEREAEDAEVLVRTHALALDDEMILDRALTVGAM